jgi:iron(III) transport system ATP-binding protein
MIAFMTPETVPALRLRGVKKSFGDVRAVDAVDLEIGSGEIVALVGPSGSGKSTVLRTVAGLSDPDAGTVEINGRDCSRMAPEYRGVGFVFQDCALFPHLDVARNIGFGLIKMRRAERVRRVNEVLELVGLQGMANRLPHQLSGGQSQRVALARALAPSPSLLLLDEPFSNLDPQLRRQVRHEVLGVLRSCGAAALWVTHDHDEGLIVSDRVAVMDKGVIRQVGTPAEIWRRPADAWVAGFIGHGDLMPGQVEGGMVHTELGRVPATGLDEGAAALVLVRAHDVELDEAGTPGTVVRRHFSGNDNVYCVQLQGGRLVHMHQPADVEFVRGQQIAVRIASERLPVFAEEVLLGRPQPS